MRNNEEIHTSYGTVRNIDRKKFSNTKLYKKAAVTISSISLAVILLITGCGKNTDKPIVIPEDQARIVITMNIDKGESISSFADRLYSSDCAGVYGSISNYQDAIKEQNNIHKASSYIQAGDVLEIPVIVDKDNPYYLEILELEKQIADIEENNLWVKYTVKYGDTLSKVAALSSATIEETYEKIKEIAYKNDMSTKDMLRDGTEIWIMNPELGKLKLQLNVVYEELTQSLISQQTKK